jgi:hypothetical protein
MIRRIPVFQQAAVCLTKFGPESGETAEKILARRTWNGVRPLDDPNLNPHAALVCYIEF